MGSWDGFGEIVRMESDDEFRARLAYVCDHSRVPQLRGEELDKFAEQYRLKRRKL